MGWSEAVDEALERGGHDDLEKSRERWVVLCVCGHTSEMHGLENGGTYGGPEAGVTVRGCAGPTANRGTPKRPLAPDGMQHILPTCPCTKVRPVAEVDRPGRYFRQKTWTRDAMHPMLRGLKAMRTRLSGAKTIKDPAAEFERRLRWIPGARKCQVCKAADGTVMPVYVDKARHSELRCAVHADGYRGEEGA